MTGLLEALIGELEAFDLAALLDDPLALAEATDARAGIVRALQAFDFSAVDAEERAGLRPRLAQVIERDREVLLLVQQARDEAARGLSQLTSGRAGVRGYGAQHDYGGVVTKRVG
jgi:acyl-CoA reductase-like NAD-dependent aldehyde dehydrogenase